MGKGKIMLLLLNTTGPGFRVVMGSKQVRLFVCASTGMARVVSQRLQVWCVMGWYSYRNIRFRPAGKDRAMWNIKSICLSSQLGSCLDIDSCIWSILVWMQLVVTVCGTSNILRSVRVFGDTRNRVSEACWRVFFGIDRKHIKFKMYSIFHGVFRMKVWSGWLSLVWRFSRISRISCV